MTIQTLTQSEETAYIGRLHWRAVQCILDRYEGRVDWVWEQQRRTSQLTIQLNCDAAWELRDELTEFFEELKNRRTR